MVYLDYVDAEKLIIGGKNNDDKITSFIVLKYFSEDIEVSLIRILRTSGILLRVGNFIYFLFICIICNKSPSVRASA